MRLVEWAASSLLKPPNCLEVLLCLLQISRCSRALFGQNIQTDRGSANAFIPIRFVADESARCPDQKLRIEEETGPGHQVPQSTQ